MKNLIRLGVVVFAVATTLGFSGVLWKLENMNAWMREVGNSGTYMQQHLGRQMAAQQKRIPPAIFESPPPSPFSKGSWENVTGPWDTSKTLYVRAFAGFEGHLYVGLGTSERGPIPLWRFDGKNWDHVTGPWGQNYPAAYSIHEHNGNLYVGTEGDDAEVWRLAEGRWSNISGDWAAHRFAYSMAEFDGALFIGTEVKADEYWEKDGAVFRLQGDVWEQIGGDGINGSWSGQRRHKIYELWPHGGRLYAGVSTSVGNGEVWSFDGAWRKEPERYSADSPTVEAFTSYQGRLIAATSKHIFPSQYLSAWALTDSWAPIVSAEHALTYSLSAASNINALITFGDRLLAGGGGASWNGWHMGIG